MIRVVRYPITHIKAWAGLLYCGPLRAHADMYQFSISLTMADKTISICKWIPKAHKQQNFKFLKTCQTTNISTNKFINNGNLLIKYKIN